MRVLHVIPSVAPRDGGPSQAIAPMCRALQALGIDVTLATTDADGPSRLDVPLSGIYEWHGVPTQFFRRTFSESFKYSPALSRWLRAHVADYDVVHAHALLSHAPLAAGAASRRMHVPYVVRPLGTVASWSLGRHAWRKSLLLKLGGERCLRGAAAIHCTTEEERADLAARFGVSTGQVVPLGIDLPESFGVGHGDGRTAGEGAAGRYVLALSRLDPKKNFELLIDAFLDARRSSSSPWRLIIAGVGDHNYEHRLRALVHGRNADTLVTFAGWVEGDAKRRLIANASVFALTSRHENFGLSVLEAMAVGVPVLISREVQLATAVQEADAGWVTELTPMSVVDTLRQVLQSDAERGRRAEAARRLASRYSWTSVAQSLYGLYQSLQPVPVPVGAGSHPYSPVAR